MIELKNIGFIILEMQNNDLKLMELVFRHSSVDNRYNAQKNAIHEKIKEEILSRGLKLD
jgi:hypothetical protein